MTRVPVSWRAHEAVAMADRPKRRTRITVDLSDADAPMFVISVAAELSGMHPQTLRSYDRMGIVSPGRATGGGRRYSQRDIELLRAVAELTASGIGIEGVRRILELEHQVDALRARNDELTAELKTTREALRDAVLTRRADAPPSRLPVLRQPDPSGQLVVWRRGR
jgi:MerR family transcriptional regulator/heat shock protein HspR